MDKIYKTCQIFNLNLKKLKKLSLKDEKKLNLCDAKNKIVQELKNKGNDVFLGLETISGLPLTLIVIGEVKSNIKDVFHEIENKFLGSDWFVSGNAYLET